MRQMFIDKLEKSNEAKTEVLHFVSSSNVYIIYHDVTSVRSARHWLTRARSSEERKKLFFGALPNILDSGSFDRRCNINLIRGRILSRIIFLQESTINRHHECTVICSYKTVCSIWVNWLYYKWSFPFGLEFPFGLMRHHHGSANG